MYLQFNQEDVLVDLIFSDNVHWTTIENYLFINQILRYGKF